MELIKIKHEYISSTGEHRYNYEYYLVVNGVRIGIKPNTVWKDGKCVFGEANQMLLRTLSKEVSE